MRPARLLRVSLILLTHPLLDSLQTATSHTPVSLIWVTKAIQNVEVASRSRRQYGIWGSASGPTHARIHDDHLAMFLQVNERSTRRSHLLCTPSLLRVEFLRICARSLEPLEAFLWTVGDEPFQSFFQSIYPPSFLDTCSNLHV